MEHTAYVAWQQRFLRVGYAALRDGGAIYYNHKPRVQSGRLISPLEYVPDDLPVRQIVVWARPGGINTSASFYMPTHEWIVIIASDSFRLRSKCVSAVGDVWRMTPKKEVEHPAPFPLALPLRIIDTTAFDVYCDPFLGSGTTAVACIYRNRKCIGIEKSVKYFNIACKRVQRAYDDHRNAVINHSAVVKKPKTILEYPGIQ